MRHPLTRSPWFPNTFRTPPFKIVSFDKGAGARGSGLETILVLSGVTREEDVRRFPYQPTRIVKSIGDIEP
jgi:hypothetical protein